MLLRGPSLEPRPASASDVDLLARSGRSHREVLALHLSKHEGVVLDGRPTAIGLCIRVTVPDEPYDQPGPILLAVGHVDAAGAEDAAIGTSPACRVGRRVHLDEAEHPALAGHGPEPQGALLLEQSRAATVRRGEVPLGEGIVQNALRQRVGRTGRLRERGHRAVADLHLVAAAQTELREQAGDRRRDQYGRSELNASVLHGYHWSLHW